MKRIQKKQLSRKRKITSKKSQWLFLLLLPVLFVTIFALTQVQQIQQFASTSFSTPPLFGCLQVGKGTSDSCGTKLGESENINLFLHDRPYKGETVYYNDTLTAKASYKNIDELPITAKYLGIAAGQMAKQYYVAFDPLQENITIPSQQSALIPTASYTVRTPDPDGEWIAGIGMTDNNDQMVPLKQEAAHFSVSPICTGLRVQQLTNQDKNNIKALCAKDPNNKLCKSRQYCEIFKGGQCAQPNLGEPKAEQQCDQYIVLEKKEQDILEELCKVYPNTDACKNFCDRALESSICPKKIIWVDNRTGKQVYPQKAKYLASINSKSAVAGTSDRAIQSAEDTTSNQSQEQRANLTNLMLSFAQAITCNATFGKLCPHFIQPIIAQTTIAQVLGAKTSAFLAQAGRDGAIVPGQNVPLLPPARTDLGRPVSDAPAIGNVNPGGGSSTNPNPFPPKPKGTGPGQSMDPRNYAGYQPSCASHRGNQDGQCCASDYPLINGCCQPGCFVYHSEPESRSNCQYKNKSGQCCSKNSVEVLGYCQPNQAPGIDQIHANVPRDPKIFPPGANPAFRQVPATGGSNSAPAPKLNSSGSCASCPSGWTCGGPELGPHCVKTTVPAGSQNETPQYKVPANCEQAAYGNCLKCKTGYYFETGTGGGCQELLRAKHNCSHNYQCASNKCVNSFLGSSTCE